MKGRDRLLRAFAGDDLDRPVFLPLLGGALAPVAGSTVAEVIGNPSRRFAAQRDAARLFATDAHLVVADAPLVADALGAPIRWDDSGGWPAVLEPPWATALPASVPERLTQTGLLGAALDTYRRLRPGDPEIGLGVVVTGPLELAATLGGSSLRESLIEASSDAVDALDVATSIVVALIRAAGEAGCDLVVLVDRLLPDLYRVEPELASEGWTPIANLAAFYGASTLISTGPDEVGWPASPPPGRHLQPLEPPPSVAHAAIGLTAVEIADPSGTAARLAHIVARSVPVAVATFDPLGSDAPTAAIRELGALVTGTAARVRMS